MLNIRETLLTQLNSFGITQIELYKDMVSTSVALQDTHEAVYDNSACLIGDSYYEIEPFIQRTSKVRYFIQLLVCAKSQAARDALEDTTNTLVTLLHNNRLNSNLVIDSEVIDVERTEKPTIQFHYKIINYEVLAYSEVNLACPLTHILTGFDFDTTTNPSIQEHTFYGEGTTPSGITSSDAYVTYSVTYDDLNTLPPGQGSATGLIDFTNGSWTKSFNWAEITINTNFNYTFTLVETSTGLTYPISFKINQS